MEVDGVYNEKGRVLFGIVKKKRENLGDTRNTFYLVQRVDLLGLFSAAFVWRKSWIQRYFGVVFLTSCDGH